MKTASSALLTLLGTRQFWVTEFYTYTLVDGTVLYYTSAYSDLTYNGNTYLSGGETGPYHCRDSASGGQRGLGKWRIGVETDTLQYDVLPGPSGTVEGFPFLQAIKYGLFDGAEVSVDYAFMPNYGDLSAGVINKFTGRVVEVDCGRSVATFNINSHLELLNQQMPRNLFQASCRWTLFDTGCTLSKASFKSSSTAQSGSTASKINTTLSQSTGYFDLGSIKFTGGQNSGFQRTVTTFVSATSISLLAPLPFVPSAGDPFDIYPGCDKTQSTCSSKFSNLANFGGTPYIPNAEVGI